MKELTTEDIRALFNALIEHINPLMTYDEASEYLGKSKHAVIAKVSRSGIKVINQRKLIRFSDVKKIQLKEV